MNVYGVKLSLAQTKDHVEVYLITLEKAQNIPKTCIIGKQGWAHWKLQNIL